jgi:hypothetical protein
MARLTVIKNGKPRVPCQVPGCGITAAADFADEIVCRKHWALTDKRLRRLFFRCKRVMDREPPRYAAARRVYDRTWGRLVQQAIERAVGISA